MGVAVKCATITPNAAARGGVRPQADVEEPQRHHPRHAGRHGVPRAHHGEGHRALRAQLGKAHHHRPPRLRRRVQERRDPRARPRQGGAGLHRRGRHRDSGETRARVRRPRRGPGHAQPGRLHRQLRHAAASSTPWTPSRICGSPRRTPSPRSTTTASRISSRRSTTTEYPGRVRGGGHRRTSTRSSTTPWPASSAAEGGFIWACKNYDGDVMSDMVSTAFGSPGHDDLGARIARRASTSTRPPTARCTRHYYKHLKGEETSTNSVATIFAWTRRPAQARRAGRPARAGRLRRPPGSSHPGHHRGRRDDRRPGPHHDPPEPDDSFHQRVHPGYRQAFGCLAITEGRALAALQKSSSVK